jgi:hypothetical protein
VIADHLSAELRRQVRARAGNRCEYCLLAEEDAHFPHEPDHIIARKHGGASTLENLALACFDCNRFKGSNIASVDTASGEVVALFNPRTQTWREHFELRVGEIAPLTSFGRVTEQTLRFNLPQRVETREILARLGEYPGRPASDG